MKKEGMIDINVKRKKIVSAIAALIAVICIVGSIAACAHGSGTDDLTETPSGAEQPKTIGADDYFCTVTDSAAGREFAAAPVKGEYRFYLPGSTDRKNLTLNCYIGENYSFEVNGERYTESMSFSVDATKIRSVKITFTHQDGSASAERYVFHASSVNILCLDIDESLGTVDAMQGDKDHETYCYGSLSYTATEGQYDFSSSFSIKGRGNATWEDEKKGYALKLYESDDYDQKNKLALSGMGKSANWILIANHRDRTLMRNALAQTLAQKLGMKNAVQYVFVDLYMNGDYLGLYMLTEKIESGKDQVDISEAERDSLDGGYLLEFDNYSDTPQIKLDRSGLRVTINDPSDLSSYSAIEGLLNEAETAISDPGGYNRRTGKYWYDYIDINSFAILWMVREYTMDFDANVNFRFYYDPSDGKFHGGPAWDFDNSMARSTGIYADPEFALIESGERNQNCWLTKLMAFDAFREEIGRLYTENIELFTTTDRASIYALANRYYSELSYSIAQNFTVWERQLSYKQWNMPKDLSYDGHFGILTDFLKKRNLFWSTYIPKLAEKE